ncbi:EAL domain-containing protein [Kineococcus sp. NBC_00420]|uniref:putative bifunctional diguanylate cyclase/phosphodiesterase n=1 Tax=Kineococcus sp. NBC_00420 TaxID=2903564 RepID=UPI002E24610C
MFSLHRAGAPTSSQQWRPRRPTLPRTAILLLLISVIGLLLVTFHGSYNGDGANPWPALTFGFSCTAVAATWWILTWRARRSTAERIVWRMFSLACLLYGVGAVTTVAFMLIPATTALVDVPAAACAAITFPLAYRALVRWSRHGAGVDADDLLNGTSSVLVVIAVLGSVLVWTQQPFAGSPVIEGLAGGSPAGPAGRLLLTSLNWHVQLLIVQDAAVLVLVTAALTAAFSGRLYRDPRLWLVTAAYALAGAGGAAALLDGGTRPMWTIQVWALGLLAFSSAALLPVRFVPTQSSDPVKSTVGSFVIVLAGLGIAVAVVATGAPGILAVCGLAGVLGSSIRLLVNLTELAQLAISRREALTDDMTGIANRRAILRHLDRLLHQRSRAVLAGERKTAGRGVQVVVFDLDHFKDVNDSLGHSAGDDLLCMVTQRIQPALPASAVFGRLGGDEFAIISDDGPHGEKVLSTLEHALREPFPLTGMSVHVDLSIGRATWSVPNIGSTPIATSQNAPTENLDAAALLRRADIAMYDAKRNDLRTVTFDPIRHGQPQDLLSMVAELRRAITAGQLRVHYQPQLHTSTGELAGVEALVRWQHPVLGLLMPAQFLPLAESHALMDAITREVLHQAVAQQAAWRRSGLTVRVSVNLAAGTLLDASLPTTVHALLSEHDLPATSLVLEVTETALLREPDRSLAVVEALRALGAQVSIDDFGTGYSSLTQLRQLPVSELKLDRSFTLDLLADPRAAAIVANTITLAHDLGLRVVAEGVEDEATLTALTKLACDETQGYLHAKPLPADDFDRWLSRQSPRLPRQVRTDA